MWNLKLAFRNTLRNKRRSLLTVGTVFFGTMLLTIALSWIGGIMGAAMDNIVGMVGEVRVSHPDFPVRETLFPLDLNIEDVEPVVTAIEAHGMDAYPVIRTGAVVTASEDIGDHFGLIVGAPPAYFSDVLGMEVIDGGPIENDEQIWLGRELAGSIGANVGDDVVFLGQTQDGSISPIKGTTAGIVSTGSFMTDSMAYIPLSKVQWMADIEGGTVEIQAYGPEGANPNALATVLANDPALEGLSVQAWNERSPWNQFYETSRVMNGFLGGIVIFIAALGVLNTMFMSVLERTNEIGVLRAMGMSRLGVVFGFLVEGSVIGVVGSVLGIGLGAIPSLYLEINGVTFSEEIVRDAGMPMASTFYADFSVETVVTVFIMGLLMALFGALIPALRASFIQPVDAMRRKR
jgi:putative ABC transport system permease protein